MGFKKDRKMHDTLLPCSYDDFITDIDEPPSKAEILYMTLGYTMRFPLTIPVTMSTLCCMPPGAAKLDFNGHCFNKVTVVGVVCWNMKLSNHVEYYLYDPNDKSQTYFNVIQCPLFHKQYPHCYPMGTYVAATGFLVGTTESTLLMGNVKPITERQYNEYVFQARVAKFQCAVDVVPKPLLRDDDLFKVSTNCTIEQVRRQITFQLLAEQPFMAKESAYPVKFKETSDSVFNYFRRCGQKPWKPVCPLQNWDSAEPNGTPETADGTPKTADDGTPKPADGTPDTADGNETASQNHSILKNVNATVISLPYEIRLWKPVGPLQDQHSTKPNGTPKPADGTPKPVNGTPEPADGNETASQNHSILKNVNDTVFSLPYEHIRRRGRKPWKPVCPLHNPNGTPETADGTPKPADGTPKPADGNETASQNNSILENVNDTVFSLPYKHNKACKAYTSKIDNYTKLVDYFLDVDIMKLNLAVSFYNNHVPVTVDTLNALPEKDKFNWGGLTFKTVRVIGKVVSKTIVCDEIHYVLEDLQTSAQYSVLQYISEDAMFPAPITYHVGAFVEVVGDLHARTKKRNHDAVIADHVRRVKEKCPFVQKFIDNAAFVCEYDDETIQIILLAMSFTDYCRNGMPPSKFPLSVTFDLIEQFDLDTVIPVDMSGVFGHISPESCLFGLFERVYEDFYYLD